MVEPHDAVLCADAGMLESLSVESLGGELVRVVNVGVVFADEIVGELSGVSCIAIKDGVPSALGYVVDFVRVASDGSACLVLRPRYVTFEGDKWLNGFGVKCPFNCIWALFFNIEFSNGGLLAEVFLPLGG